MSKDRRFGHVISAIAAIFSLVVLLPTHAQSSKPSREDVVEPLVFPTSYRGKLTLHLDSVSSTSAAVRVRVTMRNDGEDVLYILDRFCSVAQKDARVFRAYPGNVLAFQITDADGRQAAPIPIADEPITIAYPDECEILSIIPGEFFGFVVDLRKAPYAHGLPRQGTLRVRARLTSHDREWVRQQWPEDRIERRIAGGVRSVFTGTIESNQIQLTVR